MKKYLFGIIILFFYTSDTFAITYGGCFGEDSIDPYVIQIPFQNCIESQVYQNKCQGGIVLRLNNKCNDIYKYKINDKEFHLYNGYSCRSFVDCAEVHKRWLEDYTVEEKYGLWLKKLYNDNGSYIYLVGANVPKGVSGLIFLIVISGVILLFYGRKIINLLLVVKKRILK